MRDARIATGISTAEFGSYIEATQSLTHVSAVREAGQKAEARLGTECVIVG